METPQTEIDYFMCFKMHMENVSLNAYQKGLGYNVTLLQKISVRI